MPALKEANLVDWLVSATLQATRSDGVPPSALADMPTAFWTELHTEVARQPRITHYEVAFARGGEPLPLAAAAEPALGQWNAAVRPAGKSGNGEARIAVIAPDQVAASIERFCIEFGMAPAVRRTLVALYRRCDVRGAAQAIGIGYHGARANLALARQAVGAAHLAHLLTLAISSAVASTPLGPSDTICAACFGLTTRQARLAALITSGSTRAEAARLMGISDAVAKVEMAAIFAAMDIDSGLQLARMLAEFRLLVAATSEHGSSEPHPPPPSRDFRVQLPHGRVVGGSDYGPRCSRPVMVLHSSMTTRPVNRVLVEALQNAGYRPVAIDRPGFGDTDLAGAPGDWRGYLASAVDDIAAVCSKFGWDQIDIITRGAAQVVLALIGRHPLLLRRAVVLNPDPDSNASTGGTGIMGAMKRNFRKRPGAIEMMARPLAALSTLARTRDNILRMTKDCPGDFAAMSDPANMADYYRGIKPFRGGQFGGFALEQAAIARMERPAPLPGERRIVMLVGGHDFVHHPHETFAYWRVVLPDADIRMVADGGRFLAYTHAPEAVALLE